MSYRQKKAVDTSFYGGPEDQGGVFPGPCGNKNPRRDRLFSSTNQPKRRRRAGVPITDARQLGATALQTLVPSLKNGRQVQIPALNAAVEGRVKDLLVGNRLGKNAAWRFFTELGSVELLGQLEGERKLNAGQDAADTICESAPKRDPGSNPCNLLRI